MQPWVQLATAAMWPVTVVILILSLRRPLGTFLSTIGGRITRLSVLSVSVDLVAATPADTPWIGRDGSDVRGLTPAGVVNDSTFWNLREALLTGDSADYFVVDLKEAGGRVWLSSRLYLFAYLFKQLKGARAVVFVGSKDVGGTFLGVASIDRLLSELGRRHPWYPAVLWQAEGITFLGLPRQGQAPSLDGWWQGRSLSSLASTPPPASVEQQWRQAREDRTAMVDPLNLAREFLERIQLRRPQELPAPDGEWVALTPGPPPAPAPAPPPAPPRPGEAESTWELAAWVTASELRDDLAGVIDSDAKVVDRSDWSQEDRVTALARTEGQFVALTTASGRFARLIDRPDLLQRIGRRVVEPQ